MDKTDADHFMPEDGPTIPVIMRDLRRSIVDKQRLQALGLVRATGSQQVSPCAVPFPFVEPTRDARTAISQPVKMRIYPKALFFRIAPEFERMPKSAQRSLPDPWCKQFIGNGYVVNEVVRRCLVQQRVRMRMVADVVAGRQPVVQNARGFRFDIERP